VGSFLIGSKDHGSFLGGRESIQVASVAKGRFFGFLIRSVTCRDATGCVRRSRSSVSCRDFISSVAIAKRR
jgi:hypothetical protein